MNSHRLKIRCPTWDHLENFYERKVKPGNFLLARVPFSPAIGDKLVIALELPDSIVIELDAEVLGTKQAPDGKRSAIRMYLYGLDEVARERLSRAVASGRRGTQRVPPLHAQDATLSFPRTQTGVPVPLPSDVPIDEEVIRTVIPKVEDVPEKFRERYRELERLHANLREKAAHEVLGVSWDADVTEIRSAYFNLVKKIHPDVLARHQSDEVLVLASEISIYVNQAYDRLRDSAVSAGKAIAAGPALLPHTGWSANFDEIGTVRPRQPRRSDDLSAPVAVSSSVVDPSTLETSTPETSTPEPFSPTQVQAPGSRDSIVIQFSGGSTASIHGGTSPQRKGDPTLPSVEKADETPFQGSELFADVRDTRAGMSPLQAPPAEKPAENPVNIDILVSEGKSAMLSADFAKARVCFAQVLEVSPRDRETRALYHVAFAYTLRSDKKDVEALTQIEVALQHNPNCSEAASARAEFEKGGGKKMGRLRKWFRS